MTTTACAQPGCTGAILDGYCDVCGSPGPASAGSAAQRACGRLGRLDHRRGVGPVHPAGLLRHDRRRVLRRLRVAGPAGRAGRPGRRPGDVEQRLGRHDAGRCGAVPLDRVADLRPAGLDGARLGPRGRRGQQGHPASRHVLDPAAGRPARRGPDLDPAGAGGRRGGSRPEGPHGAGGPADLPVVRVARGALPRRSAGTDRGLLPDLPQPVLLHAQAAGGRRGRRPVRRRRRASPTEAWAGSTPPATATSRTAGWCSRAC